MNGKQSLFCQHSNLLSIDMSSGQPSAAFIRETLIYHRIKDGKPEVNELARVGILFP